MLFFFKEKPIEITAFAKSSYAFAHEHSPIIPIKENLPKWWKNTPPGQFNWENFSTSTSTKNCPGIIQTITSGFLMSLWSDLALEYNTMEYKWAFSDKISRVDNHKQEQSPGFYEDHWHFKVVSPWFFKTSVKLIYTSPFYHHKSPLPFITPYGITTPQKGYTSSNLFLFAPKTKQTTRVMITKGTPLMHIIPLTEKKIIFKSEVVSDEEFARISNTIGVSNRFVGRGIKNIRDEP